MHVRRERKKGICWKRKQHALGERQKKEYTLITHRNQDNK
jgi:hypothetical protein